MAKVLLVSATGLGNADPHYAQRLLVYTKSTRLSVTPDQIAEMTKEELDEGIAYMAKTIRSSWEFIDLVFEVQGVSRPTSMQMIRTRTGSYAQQSHRVTDASQMPVVNPYDEDEPGYNLFESASETSKFAYQKLIEQNPSKEKARGILPSNVSSNILCKYNLRAFVDLVTARESLRTQDEYGDIIRQMKELTLSIWPWTAPFFESKNKTAIDILEPIAKMMMDSEQTGSGLGWEIAKAIDLLR